MRTLSLSILYFVFAALPVAAQDGEASGMVLVPEGKFWMARIHNFFHDSINVVPRAKMDDKPANNVFLDAFYMDAYEVTNADYSRFIQATGVRAPWHWPHGEIPVDDERLPVANVNWFEAAAYCQWAGKRLPTEAEWEKAVRGGLDRSRYSWGDDDIIPTERGLILQLAIRSNSTPAPAVLGHHKPKVGGTYPPNGYGLYDMIGNVAEWTHDWFSPDYYVFMPKENPQGPETGQYKSIRGHGWSQSANGPHLVNSFRDFSDPETRMPTIGFRCAQSQ